MKDSTSSPLLALEMLWQKSAEFWGYVIRKPQRLMLWLRSFYRLYSAYPPEEH